MTPKDEAAQALRIQDIDHACRVLANANAELSTGADPRLFYALEARLAELTRLLDARAEAAYAEAADGFLTALTIGRARDLLPKLLDEVERHAGASPVLCAHLDEFLAETARLVDARKPMPAAIQAEATQLGQHVLAGLYAIKSVAARLEALAALKEVAR